MPSIFYISFQSYLSLKYVPRFIIHYFHKISNTLPKYLSNVHNKGKIYSYSGKKKVNGVVYEDGAEALKRLEDFNCLHFKMGVLLGVSEPRYSQEELDKIQKETLDTTLKDFEALKEHTYV